MKGLNWYWITMQLTVAPLLGLVVAIPFWRRAAMIFGNLVGSGMLLGWAVALLLREYVEVDRYVKACLDEGTWCFPEPGAEMRFAVYIAIGFGEVFLLFFVSLAVERRISNRDYAKEWRR